MEGSIKVKQSVLKIEKSQWEAAKSKEEYIMRIKHKATQILKQVNPTSKTDDNTSMDESKIKATSSTLSPKNTTDQQQKSTYKSPSKLHLH